MAARRVATSAIEWAAFAERVSPNQKDAYRAFKAKSDMFVSRVHKLPENRPNIDWAFYKSRLTNPAMVDEFKKQYDALSVPYPKDKANTKSSIDAQEKTAQQVSAKMVSAIQANIADMKALLAKIDSVPPIEEMTQEMYSMYFPDQALDPVQKPSFWPHQKIHQPQACGGTDKDEYKVNDMSLGKYGSA